MTANERPVRRAVSCTIRRPGHPGEVLTVPRPSDDEELPNLWGLPAGSLRPGESWEDAVRRSGQEKLGVRLGVGRELNRGTTQRETYTLEMRLYEATIVEGQPSVPQRTGESLVAAPPNVTQYAAWRWAPADALAPAGEKGSLCCRLYLELQRHLST